MYPPFPLWLNLRLALAAGAIAAFLLFLLFRPVWRRRPTKMAYAIAMGTLLLAHAAWAVGPLHHPTSYWGAALASSGIVILACFNLSLPLAAAVRFALGRFAKMSPAASPAPAPTSTPTTAPAWTRRNFIGGVTALVPALAVGGGISGFAKAGRLEVPRFPFSYRHLHPDLDGLEILHLSDLHLGMSKNIEDLEQLLSRLDGAARRPDLIVLTGDIAEDVQKLPDALSLLHQFRARYGVFACLGNHEYLRGIHLARSRFDKSQVPLLVNEGVSVEVGRSRLWIGGIDDPVVIHGDIRPTLRPWVHASMRDAPSDAFRLLLAHRPEAFDAAAANAVDLTLSGHTHGGQIGFNGKSAFEPLYRDGYLWGSYTRGPSRLYTTSGFGHWFPFRLGCPTEAPVLTLTRAAAARSRVS